MKSFVAYDPAEYRTFVSACRDAVGGFVVWTIRFGPETMTKEQDMSDQQQQNPQPEQNPQPQQQPDNPAPVEPAPVDQPATTQEQQDTEG